MAGKGGTAKDLVTLWQTRVENMLSGEVSVDELETLLKAAKVGNKKAIKFLAFKNTSRGKGIPILNILAEPCDPYVKEGAEPKAKPSW